ncbi:MAG: hypothetical protein IBJ03_09160 [Gemmatimonadaceae bacterium]|nr:hypothetical protein [Gemmatimonadaceae bacterium]
MSDAQVTAESVAALLDGRLTGEERARVLRLLAEDPEWRDVALEAMAMSAESDRSLTGLSAVYDAAVVPAVGSRTWSRTGWALAASLFAAVALGGVWWQTSQRAPALAPLMEVAMIERSSVRSFEEPLLGLRGGRALSAGVISDRARSVAIGAMSAALVSARAQSAVAGEAANDVTLGDLLAALRDVPGTAPQSAALRQARTAEEVAVVATAIRLQTDSAAFDVGAYLHLRRSGVALSSPGPVLVESWLRARASEDISLAAMIERVLVAPAPALADSVLQVLVRVR